MGTAVLLRSDDCFQCLNASSIRSQRNSNSNPNPNQNFRKKRSPTTVNVSPEDRDRSRCGGDRSGSVVKHPGANLVMGQVKILKRGEKLIPDNAAKKSEEEDIDLVLGSTDRLGPDPVMVQKQVRVPDLTEGMYAGPPSVASPPPSSVPVPVFIGRKKNTAVPCDLRRMPSVIVRASRLIN